MCLGGGGIRQAWTWLKQDHPSPTPHSLWNLELGSTGIDRNPRRESEKSKGEGLRNREDLKSGA